MMQSEGTLPTTPGALLCLLPAPSPSAGNRTEHEDGEDLVSAAVGGSKGAAAVNDAEDVDAAAQQVETVNSAAGAMVFVKFTAHAVRRSSGGRLTSQ
jgi:hypothetical protein